MNRRKSVRYSLSDAQIEALKARLSHDAQAFSEQEETNFFPEESVFGEQREASLPIEECLSDDQYVAYAMQALNTEAFSQLRSHVNRCSRCAEEVLRLHSLAGIWEDEPALQHLEARIARSQQSIFASIMAAWRVPLKSLILPQGAFGEGLNAIATTSFPVVGKDGIVPELRGMLVRQNRDYYLQVNTANPQDSAHFVQHRIRVTLTDPAASEPLLRRYIEIGVTVMLGTDIKLTEDSYLEAVLLPEEQVSA